MTSATYDSFTHAIVRMPGKNMAQGLTTQDLGIPVFDLALGQYHHYLDALRACGLALTIIEADESFPDSQFVEDTAVLYGDLAVITQPGAESRRDEHLAVAPRLPHKTKVNLTGDAYLDGGDVLFCAGRVLIGLSKRTNRAGAEHLRTALHDYDATLKIDFVPFSGVLHLKTGLTELAPGVLIRSPYLETDLRYNFAETIMVFPAESYAANVLPINGSILIAAGYPTVAELASRYFTRILEIPMSEFQKMDGGLTCLSLRYSQ